MIKQIELLEKEVKNITEYRNKINDAMNEINLQMSLMRSASNRMYAIVCQMKKNIGKEIPQVGPIMEREMK